MLLESHWTFLSNFYTDYWIHFPLFVFVIELNKFYDIENLSAIAGFFQGPRL